jgi:hypothetical protein
VRQVQQEGAHRAPRCAATWFAWPETPPASKVITCAGAPRLAKQTVRRRGPARKGPRQQRGCTTSVLNLVTALAMCSATSAESQRRCLPSCTQDCQRAQALQADASVERIPRLQACVVYNLNNIWSHLEGAVLRKDSVERSFTRGSCTRLQGAAHVQQLAGCSELAPAYVTLAFCIACAHKCIAPRTHRGTCALLAHVPVDRHSRATCAPWSCRPCRVGRKKRYSSSGCAVTSRAVLGVSNGVSRALRRPFHWAIARASPGAVARVTQPEGPLPCIPARAQGTLGQLCPSRSVRCLCTVVCLPADHKSVLRRWCACCSSLLLGPYSLQLAAGLTALGYN